MTSDPPATGTFDGSLLDDLVVDVCILSAAGSCDSPPVRQFRSTGSTLYQENIRVDNTRFFYLVYWNTGAGSVDPAKHYRITTRAGSVVLGYADVDVVNNSTELAAVDRTQFAGVVKGNWLPIRFRVNQGALAPVRYLSPPQLSPSGTLVGTPVPVTVRIGIVPSPGAAIQAVRLAQVDAGGQPTGDVAQLFDDGNLASGDDIKGDGVFSGRFSPASNTAQTLRYAVVTQGTFNSQPFSVKSEVAEFKVLSTLPQDDLAKILGAQQKALEALDGSSVTTLGAAMGVLIASLQQDQAVAGVVQVDPNMLEIHFTNGLIGGILLTDGTIKGGGGHAHGPVRAHGPFSGPERPGAGPPRAADAQAVQLSTAPLLGYAGPAAYTFVRADTGRRKTAAIPVEQQTRGVNGAFVAFATPPPPEKAVKSNRMLLYEPSYTEFLPFRDGDDAKALAAKSDVSLQVTHLKDGQASVDALKQLTDYGVILINTHGTGGNVFLSGEVVTLGGWISHAFDILQDRLRVTSHAVVRLDGSGNVVQSEKSVFAVTNKFIAALPGTFPNSIVIADYCQGMKSPQALATAFRGKGALAYLGYSNNVSVPFANTSIVALLDGLLIDLKTVGESHTVTYDPVKDTHFQREGDPEAHLSRGLINGDFEFGNLTAWTASGDGRVITQLGFLAPTQKTFMGIISTGLGFTASSGSISQSVTIPAGATQLVLRWNFLSEEFREYIGSSYQDFFRVEIREEGKAATNLLNLTIDGVAAAYPLTHVSPQIVFDQGDVWMTNWQQSTLNVGAWAGKKVTLTFSAGDVGDSIYDTAILLDEIALK